MPELSLPDLPLPDLGHLVSLLQMPWVEQLAVGALAFCAGLLMVAVFGRIDLAVGSQDKALAAYRDDEVDTPLERLGSAAMRRAPGLRNLLNVSMHRRWLLLEGKGWSVAATVGLALVLSVAGFLVFLMVGVPALLVAPLLGFMYPFIRQRSQAEQVRNRVQNALPDLSAMLAAEMAAGNAADVALERGAQLGGPLAALVRIALAERGVTGRQMFSRGRTPGVLIEVASRYDLPALKAFVAQIDMAAKTGAAGPELMSGLAHTLIVEYKDRALREAEALDTRLAVPTVGFFFMPFLFLILVPLLLPVLNAL